jgi:hypothetical protein
MKCRFSGLLLLAGLLLPAVALADSTVLPAWEFSTVGNTLNNATGYSLGEVFTVNQNITVDYLGYFYDSSAGMSESHQVSLYDADGHPLASTTITNASLPDSADHFLFNYIKPITLIAGETYVIDGASGVADLYTWNDQGFTVYAPITLLGDNWSGNGGSTAVFTGDTPANGASDGFGGADFGTTPEPSSFLLLGSGLAGLAGLLKRKLRA